jgi:hypothetical protein
VARAEEVVSTDHGKSHRVLRSISYALGPALAFGRAEEASVRGDE